MLTESIRAKPLYSAAIQLRTRMKHELSLKAIAIIFLAVVLAAFAQESGSNSQHQDQSMQGMHGGQNQQGPMGGMMQNCQKNMRDMEQRHEKLRTKIESAKQSTAFSGAGLSSAATDVSGH
jgi:hypothetical protein